MTIYQKILSVFALVNNRIGMRAARTELATPFLDNSTYAVGDLVIYDDQLYCCKENHTGAWNTSHFSKATVNDALALKSGSGGHDIAVVDETLVINKGKDSGDSGSGDSGSGGSGSSPGTTDLSGYYTSNQTDQLLDRKVDKVDGKVLSTNDFTDALLEKLEGLSTSDTDLSEYYTREETDELLDEKVDAVDGKGLSTNDFTNALKTKLEGLSDSGTGGTTDLSNYVTNDILTTTLSSYAKTDSLTEVIESVNTLSSQVSSANSRLEAIA